MTVIRPRAIYIHITQSWPRTKQETFNPAALPPDQSCSQLSFVHLDLSGSFTISAPLWLGTSFGDANLAWDFNEMLMCPILL